MLNENKVIKKSEPNFSIPIKTIVRRNGIGSGDRRGSFYVKDFLNDEHDQEKNRRVRKLLKRTLTTVDQAQLGI